MDRNRIFRWNVRLIAFSALAFGGCGMEPRDASSQQLTAGGDPEVSARMIFDLREREAQGRRTHLFHPDGRSVVLSLDGAIAIEDLPTGSLREIMAVDERLDAYAWPSAISRDGNWLAFTRDVTDSDPKFEIGVIRADGSGERTLLTAVMSPGAPIQYPDVHDISPDGSVLLASLQMADQTWRLALVSTSDGSYRTLRDLGWRRADGAAFSPDGGFVGYGRRGTEPGAESTVYALSADGRREVALHSALELSAFVGWSSDGSATYYTTRGTAAGGGNPSVHLWRLPVRGGDAAGPPTLLRADLAEVSGLRVAGERIYYTVGSTRRQLSVHAVGVDLVNSRAVTPPSRLMTRGASGRFDDVWWTPDGQIAYYIDSYLLQNTAVVLHSTDGSVRTIPLDISPAFATPLDERTLLIAGRRRGQEEVLALDLFTGEETALPHDPDLFEWNRAVQYSHRAAVKYVSRSRGDDPAGDFDLIVVDSPGVERTLYSGRMIGRWGGPWRVSPDGRLIALSVPTEPGWELRVIDTKSGDTRTVHSSDRNLGIPHWSPDGRFIVFGGPGAPRIWSVPVDGGEARVLYQGPPMVASILSIHPDGRRVFFNVQEEQPVWEAWVLENLPESRRADSTR